MCAQIACKVTKNFKPTNKNSKKDVRKGGVGLNDK